MKVVLDTNVIVSGLNYPGNESRVLELARTRRFDVYLSPAILRETAVVLARSFSWRRSEVQRILAALEDLGVLVEPTEIPDVIPHRHADNLILACAAQCSADYLVTDDRRHLLPIGQYGNTRIINARDFLALLDAADRPSPEA